MMRGKYN